jgi:hypothetical protein
MRRKSPCPLPVAIFPVRRMDVRFEQRVNIKFCVKLGKTATSPVLPWSLSVRFFSVFTTEKKAKRTATWEYRGSSNGCDDGAHRHSERGIHQLLSGLTETLETVLTAEGTTSKGTGSISCEVEFCIFYRLSLRTLRTKDVDGQISEVISDPIYFNASFFVSWRTPRNCGAQYNLGPQFYPKGVVFAHL